MKFHHLLWEALTNFGANKLRSVLTVLGIVIGVAAVIAMLSIGQGAQQGVTRQIQGMGANLIYVRPGALRTASQGGGGNALTSQDAEAIAALPDVLAVAPEVSGQARVTYLGQTLQTRVLGVTPDYLTMMNYAIADGEFITSLHLTARSTVVVLGSAVAESLFGSPIGAVGKTIRIRNQPFRVIGVLESKGGTGFFSQDEVVMIPLTTAQVRVTGLTRYRGANVVSTITVQAADAQTSSTVKEAITQLLRERHLTPEGEEDFTVTSQEDILSTVSQVTNILSIFLGSIAGVSLIVGGIGIMNIMLVSVVERTREIGLRKALGARRIDILLQFWLESILLSLLGGALGILAGWGIAQLVGRVQLGGAAITPVVTGQVILLATLFSTLVGVFFGVYPAARAASLLPAEALRYE